MRRAALLSTLPLLAGLLLPGAGHAQSRARSSRQAPHTPAAPAGPPHAWLFGVWTGGLFPVLDGMMAQDCKAQPTVVFGRDAVGHSTLLGTGLVERVIETVRTTPTGAEFRFAPQPVQAGFGCDDPNTLHVARGPGNQITFPQCAAFPYPLQRCPAA